MEAKKTIWFDMDGTIYNLYKIPAWLERLRDEDSTVFSEPVPRHNYKRIDEAIMVLLEMGWTVGVITWAPKFVERDDTFFYEVEEAKSNWIASYFPSLIDCPFAVLPYGESKSQFMRDMEEEGDINILVDDNKDVRKEWRSNGERFRTINASRSFVRELESLVETC